MHIAVLTDGITPYVTGGMQRHSFHLVKHLLRKGVKVTLVHCVVGDSSFPVNSEILKLFDTTEECLSVHTLRFPQMSSLPGHYLRESYRYSCQIHDSLKGKWADFDFIYAKGFTAWCLLELKKSGLHIAPIGVKFHGYEMFQNNPKLKGKLEQFLLRPPVVFINRNADVVFSYGGAIDDIIEQLGVPSERIISIPSGIDDDWIADSLAPSTEKRNFLFIGRNEKRKGLSDLRAISDLIEGLPIDFHFVGPIPQQKRLSASNCHYHGEVTNQEQLISIIDQCQVLVAPSHSEGMPNVILEAMARGLAVVATDVGAVASLVDEKNGKLITPLNRKELKEALHTLATIDAERLMEMQAESLERVKREFRWSSIIEQILRAIKRVTFTQN